MDAILRLLMGPWTTYIIWVLNDQGPQRFGVLKRSVPGISTRMLT
ncbi:MAG TPA: transcriptional regulator, partial [Hyphomonas sp.]|nr:transcriptional regulator [Hyphomonas sp.]